MLDKCMGCATMSACYKRYPFQNQLGQKYTLQNLLNQLLMFLEASASFTCRVVHYKQFVVIIWGVFLSVNKTNDAMLIKQAHEMCDSQPSEKTAKKYSLDNVFDGKAPSNAMAFGTIFFFVFLVAQLVF